MHIYTTIILQDPDPEIARWRIEMRLVESSAFFGVIELENDARHQIPNSYSYEAPPSVRLTVTFHKIFSFSKEDFPAWGMNCILDYIKEAWTQTDIL